MTPALSILCASWCASSPGSGALLVPATQGLVYGAFGINTILPTLSLGVAAGLDEGADVAFRYDTHGGLAHDTGVTGRVSLDDGWAASLEASYLFYAIEEVGGIEAADSPFGYGLGTTLAAHHSFERAGRTHVAFGAGLSVGFTELVRELTTVREELAVRLSRAYAEVTVGWPDGDGATVLRLRAVVPIADDFRVLGYLPWIAIGRTLSL